MSVTKADTQTVSTTGGDGKQIPLPGIALAAMVRGGLIRRHSSLNRWCRANDIPPSTARAVLYGTSNSPEAQRLRQRLIEAAGLLED